MSKVKAWESTYTPGHKNPKRQPKKDVFLKPDFALMEAHLLAMSKSRYAELFYCPWGTITEGTVTGRLARIDETRFAHRVSWDDYYGSIERIEKPKPLDYRTVFPEVVIDVDAWNALVKERYPWLF